MFGLKESVVQSIRQCFSQCPGIEAVIIYGSRAKGTFRMASDIDLTILGDLDFSQLSKLETAIDDLLLPYKVDLSLKAHIDNPDLLQHINQDGKVFYQNEKILTL